MNNLSSATRDVLAVQGVRGANESLRVFGAGISQLLQTVEAVASLASPPPPPAESGRGASVDLSV